MISSTGIHKLILKWCCIQSQSHLEAAQSKQLDLETIKQLQLQMWRRHIGRWSWARKREYALLFETLNPRFGDFRGRIVSPVPGFPDSSDVIYVQRNGNATRHCWSVNTCCPPIMTGETPFKNPRPAVTQVKNVNSSVSPFQTAVLKWWSLWFLSIAK